MEEQISQVCESRPNLQEPSWHAYTENLQPRAGQRSLLPQAAILQSQQRTRFAQKGGLWWEYNADSLKYLHTQLAFRCQCSPDKVTTRGCLQFHTSEKQLRKPQQRRASRKLGCLSSSLGPVPSIVLTSTDEAHSLARRNKNKVNKNKWSVAGAACNTTRGITTIQAGLAVPGAGAGGATRRPLEPRQGQPREKKAGKTLAPSNSSCN